MQALLLKRLPAGDRMQQLLKALSPSESGSDWKQHDEPTCLCDANQSRIESIQRNKLVHTSGMKGLPDRDQFIQHYENEMRFDY
ncbi:hypothetical protein L915_18661 [Phytophthora nicotianae]|nr:hypothetical protein L915_18661 [Phytophthora nicotianae]ETL28004.1 hypothetical protein L916_18565 [Phytophthora nicotianae]ETM34445.1 hypothetical protein L914_18477 [Phytophthora nicotianae]